MNYKYNEIYFKTLQTFISPKTNNIKEIQTLFLFSPKNFLSFSQGGLTLPVIYIFLVHLCLIYQKCSSILPQTRKSVLGHILSMPPPRIVGSNNERPAPDCLPLWAPDFRALHRHGVPKALLRICFLLFVTQCDLQLNAPLDAVELFAGKHRITSELQIRSFRAVPVDRDLSEIMDISSPQGFCFCVILVSPGEI